MCLLSLNPAKATQGPTVQFLYAILSELECHRAVLLIPRLWWHLQAANEAVSEQWEVPGHPIWWWCLDSKPTCFSHLWLCLYKSSFLKWLTVEQDRYSSCLSMSVSIYHVPARTTTTITSAAGTTADALPGIGRAVVPVHEYALDWFPGGFSEEQVVKQHGLDAFQCLLLYAESGVTLACYLLERHISW